MKKINSKHNSAQSGVNNSPNNTSHTPFPLFTEPTPSNFYGPGPNGYFYDENLVLGGPGSCIHSTFDFDLFNVDKDIECHILVNNNRLKKYSNIVYLNNGNNFEIEMFNPNTFTVGVKIKLNGDYISNSKLVLYPGKKIKLDRYLDENKKFLFNTYEVEDTKEVASAIKFNGLIELEFYKEKKKPIQPKQQFTRSLYSHNTNDIIGQDYTVTSFSSNNATMDFLSFEDTDFKSMNNIETGIIGKGGKSDTDFVDVDINFESLTFNRVSFQILPSSQKPIEAKDLIPHCSNCGKKAKKDHKYCTNCGTKL